MVRNSRDNIYKALDWAFIIVIIIIMNIKNQKTD